MELKKLTKNGLTILLHKQMSQAFLARGAGNEAKASEHDKTAEIISKELKSRV